MCDSFSLFCDYTTAHNRNAELMSASRMRIRAGKAAAVQGLLRGNLSPSGSKDIKKVEGETEREGGGWVDSPDLNLSVHTPSQTRPMTALCSASQFSLCFWWSNEASHTHDCTGTHIRTSVLVSTLVDITHSLASNAKLKGRSSHLILDSRE